jgi:hypothetical protein
MLPLSVHRSTNPAAGSTSPAAGSTNLAAGSTNLAAGSTNPATGSHSYAGTRSAAHATPSTASSCIHARPWARARGGTSSGSR